ncbi:MAG TPA: hypothetical protein DCO72_06115 [Ruminococcus sp.]|nr:hypothetical protein [Ruminococcus sp.]
MSKSVDLREAAIAYHKAGHIIAESAKVFEVGKKKQEGAVAPK